MTIFIINEAEINAKKFYTVLNYQGNTNVKEKHRTKNILNCFFMSKSNFYYRILHSFKKRTFLVNEKRNYIYE